MTRLDNKIKRYRSPCSTHKGLNIPELLFPRTFLHPLPYKEPKNNNNNLIQKPLDLQLRLFTKGLIHSWNELLLQITSTQIPIIKDYREDMVTRFFDWATCAYKINVEPIWRQLKYCRIHLDSEEPRNHQMMTETLWCSEMKWENHESQKSQRFHSDSG